MIVKKEGNALEQRKVRVKVRKEKLLKRKPHVRLEREVEVGRRGVKLEKKRKVVRWGGGDDDIRTKTK